MGTKQSNEKVVLWQKRIQEQKSSGQSKAAFCRERNLSRFQFDYWLKRLKKVSVMTKAAATISPFIRAEVIQPEIPYGQLNLDPKWVAEFVLHLQRGSR